MRRQEALETSLVEWKLGPGDFPAPEHDALETSLVEWKRSFAAALKGGWSPLETSLVEWKLMGGKSRFAVSSGALETSLVEWKHKKQYRYMSAEFLGNFLSGMETVQADRARAGADRLGNFLSGMETIAELERKWKEAALETSLVEWKLREVPLPLPRRAPWKLP